MKLTTTSIRQLTLPQDAIDKEFYDDDLPGFGVRVRAGGSKTFIARYKAGGNAVRRTLGKVSKLTVAQARRLAKQCFYVESAAKIGARDQNHQMRNFPAMTRKKTRLETRLENRVGYRDYQIEALKEKLDKMRRELVKELLPDYRAVDALAGGWECETWEEFWAWRNEAEAAVFRLAKFEKTTGHHFHPFGDEAEYADCPLCGDGAGGSWGEPFRGFAHFGLQRHLSGRGQEQCHVLDRVCELVREEKTEQFDAARACGSQTYEAARAIVAERKAKREGPFAWADFVARANAVKTEPEAKPEAKESPLRQKTRRLPSVKARGSWPSANDIRKQFGKPELVQSC